MTSSTPTLRDVAAEAGVSPMTASNALRGKPGVKESTRAKVIAAFILLTAVFIAWLGGDHDGPAGPRK